MTNVFSTNFPNFFFFVRGDAFRSTGRSRLFPAVRAFLLTFGRAAASHRGIVAFSSRTRFRRRSRQKIWRRGIFHIGKEKNDGQNERSFAFDAENFLVLIENRQTKERLGVRRDELNTRQMKRSTGEWKFVRHPNSKSERKKSFRLFFVSAASPAENFLSVRQIIIAPLSRVEGGNPRIAARLGQLDVRR